VKIEHQSHLLSSHLFSSHLPSPLTIPVSRFIDAIDTIIPDLLKLLGIVSRMPDNCPLPGIRGRQVLEKLLNSISFFLNPGKPAMVELEIQQALRLTPSVECFIEAGDRATESHVLICIRKSETDFSPSIQLSLQFGYCVIERGSVGFKVPNTLIKGTVIPNH